ncbi:hypothetical protein CWI38_0974p0010 [Hamiltosporidium tvaerminnensis]|uniref:Uncharacterized protein n=1 Tax=Hamiltosporidium tvaerminnensis TaxID=1176355 RepID=A0A4Q9LWC6_9MICR|nr:hypothetical protein CWI37_0059p0010 [Hamiltosporidium tvaerminnensis]TBU11930.1 hypothetical protein CWI38_0974p0010 [Hamiltosporidium tvaerminnensis]
MSESKRKRKDIKGIGKKNFDFPGKIMVHIFLYIFFICFAILICCVVALYFDIIGKRSLKIYIAKYTLLASILNITLILNGKKRIDRLSEYISGSVIFVFIFFTFISEMYINTFKFKGGLASKIVLAVMKVFFKSAYSFYTSFYIAFVILSVFFKSVFWLYISFYFNDCKFIRKRTHLCNILRYLLYIYILIIWETVCQKVFKSKMKLFLFSKLVCYIIVIPISYIFMARKNDFLLGSLLFIYYLFLLISIDFNTMIAVIE